MEYVDAQAISVVAECSEKTVGYINIYPNNTCGASGGKGYPEIVDFGVLEKYRNQGIGTGVKRARHNSSLLDAHILKPGDDTENIPDSYVIFITENDVMKGNQLIYPMERYVIAGENKVLFDDGFHTIYVNMRNEAAREVALDNV